MSKREPTEAQQDKAYDYGFKAGGEPYENPYDSDTMWLLYLAYEQGWNDGNEHAQRDFPDVSSPQ